ncbi:hypothetical protein UUU_00440 [Klebsiella pneumoniae subsp. pneumoniae DSM 30104 = JCM 1662 = NBRC 14940]|nr:hypothetical protein UUU_00440 [Klebsiella pneumoniae subsp. pneumoniae DSM 30104 = JCM 1662 = NBRC 14940]
MTSSMTKNPMTNSSSSMVLSPKNEYFTLQVLQKACQT